MVWILLCGCGTEGEVQRALSESARWVQEWADACGDGDSVEDSGEGPGGKSSADSGPANPGDAPTILTLSSPCRTDPVTALAVGGDGGLWLGCGGDRGLFRSVDRASTWEEPLVADNAYGFAVAALLPTRDGVWSCGFDPTVDPPVLLWSLTADRAHVALSSAHGAPDADELPLSTCAAIATTGDSVLVLTPEGLATSLDGGVAWRPLDGPLPAQIAALGPTLFSLSGDGSAPPTVGPLGGPAAPAGAAALPVALASPDGGATRYVLGNRPDGASLARSTDAGATWITVDLGAFTARSLAFTGTEGWIIGGALPDAPSAGTLLHSTDAGATWHDVPGVFPPLTALSADEAGAWIGGEAWLGRAD